MEANYLMAVRLRKLPNKRMQLTVDSATRSASPSLASLSTAADPWRQAAGIMVMPGIWMKISKLDQGS
jgi:hypothetical protein